MKLSMDEAAIEEDEVDITPMLDVVFLLVIFFMVTSTFIEEAKVYKIELPRVPRESAPETVSTDDTYTLTLTLDGKVYLKADKGEIECRDLAQAAAEITAANAGREEPLPVILRCDAACEYSRYVQAKNALRMAGVELVFEEVTIKARQ